MELQEAWRDVIRPTMRREPKTPGNRGVEVVMIDLNGDGIPDPPDPPEREDITVTHATTWAAHNNYVKGQTVYCNVAAFSGGSDETIYRWRLQQRDDADSSWQTTAGPTTATMRWRSTSPVRKGRCGSIAKPGTTALIRWIRSTASAP